MHEEIQFYYLQFNFYYTFQAPLLYKETNLQNELQELVLQNNSVLKCNLLKNYLFVE